MFNSFLFVEQRPYLEWKKDVNLRSKIGVDEETFNFILNLLSEELNSFHGPKSLSDEGKPLLSNENLLALLFNWLRQYNSVRSLSVDFHIPATTVEDYLPKLVDVVHEGLKGWVVPPPRIRRKVETGPLTGTCMFVDSFPIELRVRPDFQIKESKDRSEYYWYAGSRVHHWAIKVQTTFGLDNKIWDSSKAVPYAFSDQRLCRESKVPSILARNENLRGVGDLHYSKEQQFIQKIKNPKEKEDKERNKEIEGVRSSVENTISRLKDWKILESRYRGDRQNLVLVEKFTRIICAVVNIEIEKHPIRSNLSNLKQSRRQQKKKR